MVKIVNCVLAICVVLSFSSSGNALIDDVIDVIHVAKELSSAVLKAWDIFEASPLSSDISLPISREKNKKILDRIKELSRQVDATEEQAKINTEYTVDTISAMMKHNVRLELDMTDYYKILGGIGRRYRQMKKYEANREKYEDQTLIAFAEWTVSPNVHAINYLLEQLHSLTLGSKDIRTPHKGILESISEELDMLDGKEHICATGQSAQQFVYSLYSDIALTELKGYMLMQFSWMMLRAFNKGNFSEEAESMRRDYEQRSETTIRLLQKVIHRSERYVWKCDPSDHVKGETYDEVTRLLQGYVENEVDMNSEGTCRETCAFYEVSKSHGCFKDLYCSRQPKCSGKLLDCQYVDSDMWICPSQFMTNRRYDYIEYESGRTLGRKGQCNRGRTKVDSWWRYLFWHCSYCFCICDEKGPKSDRYFNLRETISDIDNNMVVSGIRFVKVNRVFHLQIQEGQLLPRGMINSSSLRWKPVDSYQIFDRDVVDSVDYHTLDHIKRIVDLDDVQADDPTHVVTGVRFRVVGTHLNLEARLCEYDFVSGKLISPRTTTYWKSNDNNENSNERRTEVSLRRPDISNVSPAKSLPTSNHNQFIKFTYTDMDKDAAQTTVPFIDIQDVTSKPPVPLSGVGIYHKGRDGFGGFLAPKLITYDFTSHVSVPQSN